MKYLFITLLSTLALFSCQDGRTYAEQLKSEERLINDYIKRNHITVVKTKPAKWSENVYWKTPSGLYFQLTDVGDTTSASVMPNDIVIARYRKITLNVNPDTVSTWNTIDNLYPDKFNYLDMSQVCEGWHEAVSYMKYNNSRAKMIIYSKLGFTEDESAVIPYIYDFRIKLQK
ncbi:MAG: DUF4827 domain-containing protein [Paludibacter sp.]|jgi:hypothetical protein|nr:DUF4827 domain-containing protein [Paludibacter sp.]